MAKPEGYRKAIRLMKLADQFGLPVITFVDTAGAFPGVEAEERGQAEAIARSTEACLSLGVPMIAAVVGEGRSEEHTSELQSLMRISYAVFCLKKKKQ